MAGPSFAILGVGSFVLYLDGDYPGFVADISSGHNPGPDRDQAITAWRNHYFYVGLPFSIAAAGATFGWLRSLRRQWLTLPVVAIAALVVLSPLVRPAQLIVLVLILPALVLMVVPWEAFVIVLLGVAAAFVVRPPARHCTSSRSRWSSPFCGRSCSSCSAPR